MGQAVTHVLADQAHLLLGRIWRRRWLAVVVAWIVAVIGFAAIPFVPERYEAKALIYVDTQSVLKPLMEGLAYQPDLDQQVHMLARTVISRPNIDAMLDRGGDALFGGAPEGTPQREALVNRLMKQITMSPGDSGLYSISYRDPVPERAKRLVEATLNLFVNSSSADSKRDAAKAKQFIAEQISSYEAKLVEAESRLKEFKIRNVGVLGLSNQDYIARSTAISDELGKLQNDLEAAERARDAYKAQLDGEDLVPPNDLTEIEASLTEARKSLDDLLRRFTEAHPDVAAARLAIERLEARKQQQISQSAQPGPAKRQAAVANSPVYQKLRVSLAEAEVQVASLRSRVAAERARRDEVRSIAGRVPQVDAELAQLNRDYDVMRKNYEQLVARRESASIGVKLDESTRLADFRVIEPPRVAERPAFPGQATLALIAVAVSLVAGIAAPLLADRLQPTFEDVRTLRELTGRPVVGTVIHSAGVGTSEGGRMALAGFTAAVAGLLVFHAGWLAWVAANKPI